MDPVKFPIVFVLILTTGIFLHRREHGEISVPRQELASMPHQLGSWKGADIPIDDGVRQVLGKGDFLSRVYQNPDHAADYVDLFIAYFPSQRFGDTIHSPKNCLPGAGWLPLESDKVTLSLAGYPPFVANRYIVAKGEDRQLVVYWYLAHGRSVASEYWARYFLFADSVTLNRSDGSLVRFVTPLGLGESVDSAQQRLVLLAGEITPQLHLYVPR